jgi:cellulose synthase/poly-beta-1,6-N-acetylglucosamine synthase-like glycosyltransferase
VGIIGGARNVGVEYSNGEFIVFTDADCVVDRDWLKNLLREFKDENVGTSSIRSLFGRGSQSVKARRDFCSEHAKSGIYL